MKKWRFKYETHKGDVFTKTFCGFSQSDAEGKIPNCKTIYWSEEVTSKPAPFLELLGIS